MARGVVHLFGCARRGRQGARLALAVSSALLNAFKHKQTPLLNIWHQARILLLRHESTLLGAMCLHPNTLCQQAVFLHECMLLVHQRQGHTFGLLYVRDGHRGLLAVQHHWLWVHAQSGS